MYQSHFLVYVCPSDGPGNRGLGRLRRPDDAAQRRCAQSHPWDGGRAQTNATTDWRQGATPSSVCLNGRESCEASLLCWYWSDSAPSINQYRRSRHALSVVINIIAAPRIILERHAKPNTTSARKTARSSAAAASIPWLMFDLRRGMDGKLDFAVGVRPQADLADIAESDILEQLPAAIDLAPEYCRLDRWP
jgi:hypothetical protein